MLELCFIARCDDAAFCFWLSGRV